MATVTLQKQVFQSLFTTLIKLKLLKTITILHVFFFGGGGFCSELNFLFDSQVKTKMLRMPRIVQLQATKVKKT